MKQFSSTCFLFLLAAVSFFILSACGGGEEESDMTLENENWEDMNLAEKDRPTVLFHFTGVD
ncbi:hypothetical protein [Salibacterium aidingense]|uniref:hypothetical protein n=1 Tax=Salibacterium aidingense TaxID=384933 RepID=UPI000412A669|nr:hypothetical protein [Salibacterium aidingense]